MYINKNIVLSGFSYAKNKPLNLLQKKIRLSLEENKCLNCYDWFPGFRWLWNPATCTFGVVPRLLNFRPDYLIPGAGTTCPEPCRLFPHGVSISSFTPHSLVWLIFSLLGLILHLPRTCPHLSSSTVSPVLCK